MFRKFTFGFILLALLAGCGPAKTEEETLKPGWIEYVNDEIGLRMGFPEGFWNQYATIDTVHIANFDTILPRYSEGNTDDLWIRISVDQKVDGYTIGHLKEQLFKTGGFKDVSAGKFVTLSQAGEDPIDGAVMKYFAFDQNLTRVFTFTIFEPGYSRNDYLALKILETFEFRPTPEL